MEQKISTWISDIDFYSEFTDQCFDAALGLCKENEAPLRALLEAYAHWYHLQEQTREELHKLGLDDDSILRMQIQLGE